MAEHRRDPRIDVPDADAAEQERDWSDEAEDEERPDHIELDVPEADALEQARGVPEEDDEWR